MPTPWSGVCVARVPRPDGSASPPACWEPGSASSSSSIALKCDRLGAGEPGRVDRRQVPGVPHRHEGRQVGVQAEERVLRPSRGTPWGSPTGGRAVVVDGISVRDDERHPRRPLRAARPRPGSRRPGTTEAAEADTMAEPTIVLAPPRTRPPPQEAASAHGGELRAARAVSGRGERLIGSLPVEVGRVEEGGHQPREQPGDDAAVLVDHVVRLGTDGLRCTR